MPGFRGAVTLHEGKPVGIGGGPATYIFGPPMETMAVVVTTGGLIVPPRKLTDSDVWVLRGSDPPKRAHYLSAVYGRHQTLQLFGVYHLLVVVGQGRVWLVDVDDAGRAVLNLLEGAGSETADGAVST